MRSEKELSRKPHKVEWQACNNGSNDSVCHGIAEILASLNDRVATTHQREAARQEVCSVMGMCHAVQLANSSGGKGELPCKKISMHLQQGEMIIDTYIKD